MILLTLSSVFLSTIILGFLSPYTPVTPYIVVISCYLVLYFINYKKFPKKLPSENFKTKTFSNKSGNTDNVVDIARYRLKKEQETKADLSKLQSNEDLEEDELPSSGNSSFEVVFTSSSVIEADFVKSMLNAHQINSKILNYHSATIIQQPISEMPLKVIVEPSDKKHALELIKQYQEQDDQGSLN